MKKHRLARPLLILALLALMAIATASIGASPDALSSDGIDGPEAKAPSGSVQSYVVLMEGAPLVAYEGDIRGMPATKPGKDKKIDPNSKAAKKYDTYLKGNQKKAQREAGVSKNAVTNTYTVALNGFSAKMTEAQALELARQDGVNKVMKDPWRQPMTDASPDFLGLTGTHGAWHKGYDGEGVVVGVIDTGIWPEHPSFADDGSYAAPPIDPLPCEFGNTAHNAADAPFTCNNKLIGARQMLATYRAAGYLEPDEFDSARDDDGHGTHTASTSAGNGGVYASIFGIPRGTVFGIAPRAHVVAYKGLGKFGGFGSDLAAAVDQAVADGVDVINYSIGSSSYAIGPDDVAFLFAADAGVFVATSNGNSGPAPATTGSPSSVPWLTSVGASTHDRAFEGSASSSDGWEYFGASITAGSAELPLVDAADAGDEFCIPGSLNPGVVAGKIVLCKRGAIARVSKSEAVSIAGGAGMILYNEYDAQSLVTDNHWVPSVQISNTDGLAVKNYIASSAVPVAQINGGEAVAIDAPWMAAFSSRGPNRLSADIVKPDITAPGVQILAGASPIHYGESMQGELFQAIAGTSMSSPHIAGLFALVKQAHPDWSPAMAKSAIMTTAYQDVMKEDGVSPADPFDMGAGHVDLGSPVRKGSAFQPGLVYDAGLLEYAAFTCAAELGIFTPGTCVWLESIGVPMDPSDLNVPSIGIANIPGSQTVQRTVTSVAKEKGWRTYRVSVDAPAGFDVTVSPSRIRLKPGQSATYYVTVTNVAAPEGEWRHGSLTWNDEGGNYSVYSPISVSAALFGAPDAVAGSGVSGSASFDVIFGYAGSYAAAPHGLAADAPTSGNIGKDPDQTYPSGDDSPAGVQKIAYPIAGAAFVRWEMVIPGDDDIDLFLEDSSGTIIAASGNGGTDELIELFLPADDTYTLVVHGWSVPNEPLPFTLNYWEVPLASAGSLSVDSAPASATIGATAPIDVSWSGLVSGTRYLGAVSHTGDVGLMGFTLIEVDTQ